MLTFKASGKFDVTGLRSTANKVARFGPAAEKKVHRAVVVERMTHDYQNRTRWLEQSTVFAMVSDSDDALEFEARQDAEYGVYVQRLGYSRFNELVEEAASELDAAFARL